MGTVLAFGGSNTHGRHERGRFAREVRWPGALEALLPAGWRVVEEGLPGRTTADGLPYFEPCLRSHLPLDAVVLDLDGADVDRFVDCARAAGVPRVLVLGEVLDLVQRPLDADGHRAVAQAVAAQLDLGEPAVRELRVVVTAEDYDEALAFYRDVLGLGERAAYSSPDGRVTILEAGRATLELADPNQAAFIDRVEVGRRVAGHIRLAFEVAGSQATTQRLADAGATVVAEPTRTPWDSLNARLETPGGLQITLFEELA